MNKYSCWFKVKEFLFLLVVGLPFVANSQAYLKYSSFVGNNNMLLKQRFIPDNLWGIDFSIISTSVHYARRIGNEWYIGAESGILPERFDWVIAGGKKTSQENTIWSKASREAEYNDLKQLAFCQLFIRWKPKIQWIEIEGGFKWAVVDLSWKYLDGLWVTRFLGTYLKPTIGLKRIKLGFRLEVGYVPVYDYGHKNEFVSIISPLVRFNFR